MYRARFVPLFALFASIFVLLGVAWVGLLVTFDNSSGSSTTPQLAVDYIFRFVLPALLGSFGVGATAVIARGALTGEATPLDAALRAVRVRSGDVLAGAVMSTAAALALGSFGLEPLGVPLVFYGPPILVHALMIEGDGYQRAGSRARELLAGQWPRAIGYLFAIALAIGLLLDTVVGVTLQSVSVLPGVSLLFLVSVTRGLVLGAAFPFLAVAMAVMYLDLKARARRRSPR